MERFSSCGMCMCTECGEPLRWCNVIAFCLRTRSVAGIKLREFIILPTLMSSALHLSRRVVGPRCDFISPRTSTSCGFNFRWSRSWRNCLKLASQKNTTICVCKAPPSRSLHSSPVIIIVVDVGVVAAIPLVILEVVVGVVVVAMNGCSVVTSEHKIIRCSWTEASCKKLRSTSVRS